MTCDRSYESERPRCNCVNGGDGYDGRETSGDAIYFNKRISYTLSMGYIPGRVNTIVAGVKYRTIGWFLWCMYIGYLEITKPCTHQPVQYNIFWGGKHRNDIPSVE